MSNQAKLIQELEKELNVRESADKHITSIPKIQNQHRIDQLYDILVDLKISQYEHDMST